MKAIYALMAASVLMIVFGLFLISQQPLPEEQDIADPTEPPRQEIGLIPALPEEDRDESIPELAADAEPGSDEWCEQMMRLSDDQWTREDSQIFADQCIYD